MSTPRTLTALPIATALRAALKGGYRAETARADLMAGVVVGIVALPLSMALAIAVGVPPQHGLYTAIVAGGLVALTGGSWHQVTGPTAAFIVILAPITAKFGISGLLTAGLMAGLLLVAMGLARLGRLIEYIPHPVTTGFTTGIATVIAVLQIKDALGLTIDKTPEHFIEKVEVLWSAHATTTLPAVVITLITLSVLLFLPRLLPGLARRIPSPLIAISLGAVAALVLPFVWPGFFVETIGSRFQTQIDGRMIPGIPPLPPLPRWPWGDDSLSFQRIRMLLPSAFAIAVLGAIESLLSAVVADAQTGKKHDPDAELLGLGLGNIVAPFFGGIAATGALARTATNIRSGGQTPIAAVIHSVVVLLAILLFAPLVAYVPMASLAGLLLMVAWNMSEAKHFAHTVRVAPRSDVLVLLTCYILTVVFDMVVAVSAGVVLASVLLIRRMVDLTSSRLLDEEEHAARRIEVPEGVTIYEIAGPLFFGAAQKAIGTMESITRGGGVEILVFDRVPAMDATGIVALESAISRLATAKKSAIIAGAPESTRRVIERADLLRRHPNLRLAASLEEAVVLAKTLLESSTGTTHGLGGSHS